MKRVIRYNYKAIERFVERALDIKNNQFSNWRSIYDIRNDENIQNLGEYTFGPNFETHPDYLEATLRVYEEL